jgi:crotonobetainyl-CoA:carnitine CoA-transferase CaiB-like acyl-CoA transferase
MSGEPVLPLGDIRVLDLGRVVSGPVCSFYLASLGADVIRIDQPGGDVSWQVPPFVGSDGTNPTRAGDRDISLNHLKRDRGKRNVSLDISTEEGREILRDLVRTADVLVENFRPGVMTKWRIGYEDLSAINPGLVYCAITGYGQSGPDRDRQGMDMIIQGVSGMMARNGQPDSPPTKVGFTACDLVPAQFAALGVVSALRQRDRTGRGQLVDIAMQDVAVALLWDEPIDNYVERGLPERWGSGEARGAPVNAYPTSDGWVTVVVTSAHQFDRLTALVGRPELGKRLPDIAARVANSAEIDAVLEAWMRERTTQEVVAALQSVSIPSGPVNHMWAARDSEQIKARSMLLPLRHPDMADGEVSGYVGPQLPIAFEGRATLPPAEPLGASTDVILRELGRTDEDIARLRSAGVIG